MCLCKSLNVSVFTGGWVTLACCCSMYSFVCWFYLVWSATPEAPWLGELHRVIPWIFSYWTNPIPAFSFFLLNVCNAGHMELRPDFPLANINVSVFCRVCFLGVLTLIISWGSLGLELAAAAVSVTTATWQSSLLSGNDVIPALWVRIHCVVTLFTVSQRLLRFTGYLHHHGNQRKRCHQPR